jgi:hypothetical protein
MISKLLLKFFSKKRDIQKPPARILYAITYELTLYDSSKVSITLEDQFVYIRGECPMSGIRVAGTQLQAAMNRGFWKGSEFISANAIMTAKEVARVPIENIVV